MQRDFDCLVTGATGFLGRAVVSNLLKRGASVRCLVRESSRNQLDFLPLAELIAQTSRSQIVRGNLLHSAHIAEAVEGVRVVYHLAAETQGLPATIFAGTVVGSRNLLQAIVQARPERVVLVSSLNVYGLANVDARNVVSEESAVDEHPEKRDIYTHAKIWQERLLQECLNGTGIERTVVRPGYIYGPSRSHLPGRLGLTVGGVLLHTNSGRPLPITYVENCADAIVFCGTTRKAGNEAYNVIDDRAPIDTEYLERYRSASQQPRVIRAPFVAFFALSYLNEIGYRWSAGHIPLVVTRYKAACAWRGHRFSSQKLKRLGWLQPVSTEEALACTFPDPVPSDQSVELPLRSAA